MPRLLKVPAEGEESVYVLIDYLIKENLEQFFKGYKIQDASLFRVLRDSELEVDEGFAPDLLKALEKELKKRSSAKAVYLQMEEGATPELLEVLCSGIDFPKEEVVFTSSDMDLTLSGAAAARSAATGWPAPARRPRSTGGSTAPGCWPLPRWCRPASGSRRRSAAR